MKNIFRKLLDNKVLDSNSKYWKISLENNNIYFFHSTRISEQLKDIDLLKILDIKKPKLLHIEELNDDFFDTITSLNNIYNPANFYTCQHTQEITEKIKRFINLDSHKKAVLLIHGESGTGKRHSITYSINKEAKDCIFINADFLINQTYWFKKNNKNIDTLKEFLISHELIIFDSIEKYFKNSALTTNYLIDILKSLNSKKNKAILIHNDEIKPEFWIPNSLIKTTILIKHPSLQDTKQIISKTLAKENNNLKFSDESINYLTKILGTNLKIIFTNLIKLLPIIDSSSEYISKESIKNSLSLILNQQTSIEILNSSNHIQIKLICNLLGSSYEDIMSDKRSQDIVIKRNIVLYLIKQQFNLNYSSMSFIFQKQHSTIIHSIKWVESQKSNKDFDKFLQIFL